MPSSPQPDDPDGNENWSAGQVVSHICEARVRFDHYGVLRQMAGLPESPPSEGWSEYIGGPKLLNRSQALEALDLLEREYDDLANAIPDDADYTERVELPPFGTMGFRGSSATESPPRDISTRNSCETWANRPARASWTSRSARMRQRTSGRSPEIRACCRVPAPESAPTSYCEDDFAEALTLSPLQRGSG